MSGVKKHLVFIINPKSGTDRVKAVADAIAGGLDADRFTYELQTTERAKHGTELAAAAARAGAHAVVAVGGDGSVNDIVAGLLGTDTKLGIIPKGSGNGLARSLAIPLDVAGALAVINRDGLRRLDVGFAGDRLFLSNAGVAFDALIAKKFACSERRGLGVYSWLVTKHLWLYRSWRWNLELDGKPMQGKAFMISIANGTQFGYNFKIAPDADPADGLLDVVVVRPFPKILGGLMALRMRTGTLLGSPYVRRYRAAKIVVSHPELKLMQTDGDAHSCDAPVTFRVERGAVGVMV